MMADIFGQEVTVPESFESSCLGAALLGLYSIGEIDSLNAVSSMVGETYQHTPNEENAQTYQELSSIYIRLARLFKEEYANIAAFQEKQS
jgi:gluconokinase